MNGRRISEELRKKRIFNAKQRQIGLDIESLNQQIHANQLTKTRDAEYERKFADEAKNYWALAQSIELQEKKDMRQQCKQIDEFRLSIQRPENRRDFDLYDPNQNKKELPPRISNGDCCPVSGIQRLDGEDLDCAVRLKKQKSQNRDMLLQQIFEKLMQKLNLREAQHHWEAALLEQDSYAFQSSRSESDERRNASLLLEDDNRNLAWKRQESRRHQKTRDEIENQKDIEFHYYGSMLTEDPSVAKHPHQSHRILPDRWKGMSKEQLEEYYRGQMQQIQDNKKRAEREKQIKENWNEILLSQQGTSHFLDAAGNREKRLLCKNLELENQQIAQEQRQYREYFNKVINTNIPTKQYFDQFNTTSR